jgi:hypothetical protein
VLSSLWLTPARNHTTHISARDKTTFEDVQPCSECMSPVIMHAYHRDARNEGIQGSRYKNQATVPHTLVQVFAESVVQ